MDWVRPWAKSASRHVIKRKTAANLACSAGSHHFFSLSSI
jgi:hypothetical protein